MPKKILNKYLILNAHKNKNNYGLTDNQIANIFKISRKTIYNYVNNPNLTINIKRNKKNIDPKIIEFIISRAVNNFNFNFKKMRIAIKKNFNIFISKHNLYKILKNNNLTYKKANIKNTTTNTNRSIDKIKNLHNKITSINNGNNDNIIFTDEAHIRFDDIKPYGWNYKNKEVTFTKNTPSNISNKRVSIIALISKNKKVGYSLIYNSCNGGNIKNISNK